MARCVESADSERASVNGFVQSDYPSFTARSKHMVHASSPRCCLIQLYICTHSSLL